MQTQFQEKMRRTRAKRDAKHMHPTLDADPDTKNIQLGLVIFVFFRAGLQ